MKLIIEVNIDGHSYPFDQDAEARLNHYLLIFRQKLTDPNGAEEVMNDILARISELITGLLLFPNQAVTLSMVEAIIAQLGLPDGSTYKVPESEHPNESTNNTNTQTQHTAQNERKLYRIKTGKTIAGVCKGLSEYFKINLTLVRLLFLLALILGSFGFWVYMVLWIALPSKKDAETTQSPLTGNRIFRDHLNKRIAGVCSGLAYYFEIDVAIIYTLFVVGAFVGGSTIAIYLILWLAIPYAKTPAEKCELYHIPPTAENLAHFSKV